MLERCPEFQATFGKEAGLVDAFTDVYVNGLKPFVVVVVRSRSLTMWGGMSSRDVFWPKELAELGGFPLFTLPWLGFVPDEVDDGAAAVQRLAARFGPGLAHEVARPEHLLVGREDTHKGVPDDEWTIGWLAFVQSVLRTPGSA